MCPYRDDIEFDWNKIFDLAKYLTENQLPIDSQAKWRCSVSRAYFAAHHLAYKYLTKNRKKYIPHEKRHSEVIEIFREFRDNTSEEIANNLDRLRGDRNKADYYNKIEGNIFSFTTTSIALAEKTIQSISDLSKSTPQTSA